MNGMQIGYEARARAVLHARRTWSRRPFRLSSTGMSDWKLFDINLGLPDRDSSFSVVDEQSWASTCLGNCPLQVKCCTFSWLFLRDPAPIVWWAMLELGPTCSVSQVTTISKISSAVTSRKLDRAGNCLGSISGGLALDVDRRILLTLFWKVFVWSFKLQAYLQFEHLAKYWNAWLWLASFLIFPLLLVFHPFSRHIESSILQKQLYLKWLMISWTPLIQERS